MQQAFPAPAPIVPSMPAARRGNSGKLFFVGLATVMLATVAAGFAPSLYLRGLGTVGLPPTLQTLPAYAYLHGIALTGWFLLFFAQALLVASGGRTFTDGSALRPPCSDWASSSRPYSWCSMPSTNLSAARCAICRSSFSAMSGR